MTSTIENSQHAIDFLVGCSFASMLDRAQDALKNHF